MSDSTVEDSSSEILSPNLQVESDIDQNDKSESNSQYYYSAGDFHFILEPGFRPETLALSELNKVPFLPEWHDGIVSIHGLIIPVIDFFKFVESQKINSNIDNSSNNKSYLLKLEHKDFQPIVIKLNAIPKMLDCKDLKNIKNNDESTNWINNYLEYGTIRVAVINHQKLFDQLIQKQ